LVTHHLAQFVVLVVKILFVEDHPGLLLVNRDLLILLFSAIRIDDLIAWWCIDGLVAWTHRSTLIETVILTPFILFVETASLRSYSHSLSSLSLSLVKVGGMSSSSSYSLSSSSFSLVKVGGFALRTVGGGLA
jgi:hypothetical protein